MLLPPQIIFNVNANYCCSTALLTKCGWLVMRVSQAPHHGSCALCLAPWAAGPLVATAGWPAQAAKCHALPAWLHYKGGWHTTRMLWGHGCAPCWACWPACHPTGHHRAQLAGAHTLCHSALAQGSSHIGGGSQPSNSGASWAQAHGLAPQNLEVGRQP